MVGPSSLEPVNALVGILDFIKSTNGLATLFNLSFNSVATTISPFLDTSLGAGTSSSIFFYSFCIVGSSVLLRNKSSF